MIVLIIILLIAAVALAIVSMALNRKSAKKLESGMRTIYKKIKVLEANETVRIACEMADGRYYDDIQMDPESDPETPEEDDSALPDEAEGDL